MSDPLPKWQSQDTCKTQTLKFVYSTVVSKKVKIMIHEERWHQTVIEYKINLKGF